MRIVKVLDKMERIFISVLFAILVLAIFSQVVNRNLLKLNISWFEEIARGCIVYVLMFATEIGLRDHSQLNVDSIVRRLPPKAANVFASISTLAAIIFSGVVGVTSIQLLKMQYDVKAVTASLGIPTYVAQASVTIGCLLICFSQCVVLVNTLIKKLKKVGEEK